MINMKPENYNNPEKEDGDLLKVEVKIRKPESDKHFMVIFDGKTEEQCRLFNAATYQVLNKHFGKHTTIFHQIGGAGETTNEPGLHGWEIWERNKDKINEEIMGQLVKDIKVRAEEMIKNEEYY